MQPLDFISDYTAVAIDLLDRGPPEARPVLIESDYDGSNLRIVYWDKARLNNKIQPSDVALQAAVVEPEVSSLIRYADGVFDAFAAAGIEYNAGTQANPIPVFADTTPAGRSNLLGLLAEYAYGKSSTDTTKWYQSTGELDLTQAQLLGVSQAVGAFIKNMYDQKNNVIVPGIKATPQTISTCGAIDASYEAVARSY